jgi:dTDP-4-dehydrorhamnose 3,5-epimerase
VSAVLSSENKRQLYVPKGFAHGFRVLSESAHVAYKLSGEFAPEAEGGVLWNDPALGIAWGEGEPLLSERDRRQPTLAEAGSPFVYGENA